MKVNSSPVMLVEDEQGRLSERRRPQKETTRETTSKQRKRRKQDHEVIVLSDDYPSEIVPVGIIDLEQGPSNPSARPNAAFLEVPISGNTIDTFGDVEIVRERKRKTRNVQSDRVITLPITESQNSSTRTESLFDPVRTQRSLSGLRINSRSRFNLNPVQLGGSVAQSNTLAYEINRSDEELARRLQQEEYEAQSNIFESGFGNGLLSIPRSIGTVFGYAKIS
ncbi:hypothetical protein HDV02_006346 [Globomyces sp. JEL0801]|nr:hypothetical protein HDV02_006346 [Globomyces sp. JEL0801]